MHDVKEQRGFSALLLYGLSQVGKAAAFGWGTAKQTGVYMANNPRSSNGHLRRKYRARFKAMAAPCGICRGRLGEIHYDEPSDAEHPLSFVIDEIKPISRYKEFGYASKEEAAQDWNNLQAAHYICNSKKSNFFWGEEAKKIIFVNVSDGNW